MSKELEESRKRVQELFKQNPELKQAFMESIQELKKPENIERMAKDTVRFMQGIQKLQEQAKKQSGKKPEER